MSVTYNPINWQDGESGGTSLDATNLNHMEQGIIDSANAINSLEEEHTQLVGKHITLEAKVNTLSENDSTQDAQITNLENSAESARHDIDVLMNFTTAAYQSLGDEIQLKADRIENSASGHFLTVNEIAKSSDGGRPLSLTLYGKATQGGTSGKNQLNCNDLVAKTISGVTYTPVTKNGLLQYVLVNGTNTSESDSLYTLGTLSQAGTFILSGGAGGGSNSTYNVSVSVDGTWNTANYLTGTAEKAVTATSSIQMVIAVRAGVTVSNLKFYPMIRLSSISDSTYEPYTGGVASPNPDYPQEVTVAGADGDIVLTSCGKNHFDKSQATVGMAVSRVNGAELTGDAYANYSSSGYCAVVPDTTYYLGIAYTSSYYGLAFYDADKNFLSGMQASKSFTTPGGCYYVRFTWVTANYDIDTIQLEVGTVATPYERYFATTAIIPLNELAGIPVSSGGNYVDESGQQWICDTIEFTASTGGGTIDGGVYVQRIGKVILDGSDDEGWAKSTTANTNRYYVFLDDVNAVLTCPCLCSQAVMVQVTTNTESGKAFITPAKQFAINTDFATLTEWKAHLSENPMELYYELAEPIATSLTSEQLSAFGKMHIFHPTTNLFTDDIGDVGMEYVADTKLYIDSKFNELATALLSAVGSEG